MSCAVSGLGYGTFLFIKTRIGIIKPAPYFGETSTYIRLYQNDCAGILQLNQYETNIVIIS